MEPQISSNPEPIKHEMPLPSEFVERALGTLPERAREIIKKRFNLDERGKWTLEGIGREFKITRERIRQIEKGAIKKIQDENAAELSNFSAFFLDIMDRDGGAAERDFYLTEIAGYVAKKYPGKDIKREKKHIVLMLRLSGKIKSSLANEKFKSHFYSDPKALKEAERAIDGAVNFFKLSGRPADEGELFSQTKPLGAEGQKITPEAFGSYIRMSAEITKNPFGQWGLRSWPLAFPKNIRDKAYLIALHRKEPAHFKKIAQMINDVWPGKKRPILSETVHNELIKDKRFILVGRGVYALAEWGYEKGTVRDIIKKALAKADRPMNRDEIVKEVLGQRMVKSSTVILNLKDKEFFENTGEGLYKLKVKS